ncbi:MAG: polyprenyl synthetase family protein [Treponema sp.]|nr:polyprenyl synthetase family protein [Treponema sp.]
MYQEYTQRISKIEAELKRWLPELPASPNEQSSGENSDSIWAENVFPGIGAKISDVSRKALTEPLSDILSRGGKRWRPLLMTLVCETFGGGDSAIPLTPLIEFSHNASLIHDDIEDDSDERRGKPAIHKTYGIDTAINSGSFFYFLSSCCLESSNIENKEFIYKLWMKCMRALHMGQAMDINWHRDISIIPCIDEYYLMTSMKTGSLAKLAAELGAHIAGAAQESVKLLGEAAEKMGIGFQILDDLKNLTTGIPGKKRGDDIVEGKKGLPILLYLEKYPDKKEKIFYSFHIAKREGTRAPEVEDLLEALNESGVFPETEARGQTFLKEAMDIFGSHEFSGCSINEHARALLNGFLKLIS